MTNVDHPRHCQACGARLARDNEAALCRPCEYSGSAQAASVPDVPLSFWEGPSLRAALASRHMGQVIRAYRQHPHHGRRGLAQDEIAAWAGLTQGQLSRIEKVEVVCRGAEALTIADEQPIKRVWQRATAVRGALGRPSQSASAQEFDERLTAFARTLDRVSSGA